MTLADRGALIPGQQVHVRRNGYDDTKHDKNVNATEVCL